MIEPLKDKTADIIQFQPRKQDHFGLCPKCRCEPYMLNVEQANFAVCHKHRVWWHVGHNLLGGWRHENEQIWRGNAEILANYSEATPFHYQTRCAP